MQIISAGTKKLFASASDFIPRFAITKQLMHSPTPNAILRQMFCGKMLIVPANIDEVKIREIITHSAKKNFDDETFSNACEPRLRKKYMIAKNSAPVIAIKK